MLGRKTIDCRLLEKDYVCVELPGQEPYVPASNTSIL